MAIATDISEGNHAAYLKAPFHCPMCQSPNVSAGAWNGDTMTQEASCESCGESWTEMYALVGVESNS